jgi:hypothetical protein
MMCSKNQQDMPNLLIFMKLSHFFAMREIVNSV